MAAAETSVRTKWMDPDFRPRPKTGHYCVICSRDLKPDQPHRRVMFELDRYEAIHSDDWEAGEQEIRARRTALDPVCIEPIGMDCARKLGLEWSRPA